MVTRTLLDYNRRPVDFAADKVVDILPEYFRDEYPNLVSFLQKYYDFMDSDATYGFSREIKDLYRIRDLDGAELEELDFIFKEIGQNNLTASNFVKPRFSASLLAEHYRVKGSLRSAQSFFRSLYGEDPEIVYPKHNLFIVGQSQIGSESLRYLQDGAVYQVLSILIRSGIPFATWKNLYKRFVHPAGFHLAGEVVLEGVVNFDPNPMPISIEDSSAGVFSLEGLAAGSFVTLTSITGIYPDGADSDALPERLNLNATVTAYSELTIEQFDAMYDNIEDALDANSSTFDEDSAVGDPRVIRMSNAIETFDEDEYDNI